MIALGALTCTEPALARIGWRRSASPLPGRSGDRLDRVIGEGFEKTDGPRGPARGPDCLGQCLQQRLMPEIVLTSCPFHPV